MQPGLWRGITGLIFLLAGCAEKSSPVTPSDERIPFDYRVEGLPDAVATPTLYADDGDTVRLSVGYVKKVVAGQPVRMLAYNRAIPGPLIRVPQGAEIVLRLTNGITLPTSLHSHGVRLEAQYDGMPGISQPPIDSGDTFTYRIRFPDAGIYWYHPHVRESYGLELGLYGNYLVAPADTAYWPQVHREEVLILDDILTENGKVRPFYKNITDFTMMGRFGNTLLANGEENPVLKVKRNEVIRFYVTNTSGSRTYNLRLSNNMRLHLVGSDNGKYEYSQDRGEALIAPSERLIFQVGFAYDGSDTVELQNFPRGGFAEKIRTLMRFAFEPDSAVPDLSASLNPLHSPEVTRDIERFRPSFDKEPDEELFITGYMDHAMTAAPLAKTVTAHDTNFTDRMGVEWYDHMFGMNALSTTENMTWILRDLKTGKENHDIQWKFAKNSQVLIRIRNDTTTTSPVKGRMLHPMPHPIHFHGQRFLVVREGMPGQAQRPNLNGLVWRDSYLIGTGFTVDILLDAGNPGKWMFHCHIPEHLEAEMKGHFDVLDSAGPLVRRAAPPSR
jgi:FtsP/CotA-like multicopper oxidase with cupredoxin domain